MWPSLQETPGFPRPSAAVASVVLALLGGCPAPVPISRAVDDAFTVSRAGAIVLDVRANDEIPEGVETSVELVELPSQGSLVTNEDGSFTYQYVDAPGLLTSLSDTFRYALKAAPGSSYATVSLTLRNGSPFAGPLTATAPRNTDTTLDPLAIATDPDGDELGLVGISSAEGGTAKLSDGKIVYRPSRGTAGTASLTYSLTDGLSSIAGLVTLTVPNTPPALDGSILFTIPGGRASDVDVSSLPVADADGDKVEVVAVAGDADLAAFILVDGVLRLTPAGGVRGAKSLRLTLSDGVETVEVTAAVEVTNAPPVPRSDSVQSFIGVETDLDAAANDTDANPDDTLVTTAVACPPAVHAALDGARIRLSSLVPGTYDCTYTVTDGLAAATGQLTFRVVDRGPLLGDDQIGGARYPIVSREVLANDVDPDGQPLTLVRIVTPPAVGTATIEEDPIRIVYRHGGVPGDIETSFTYEASSGGLSAVATVTVSLTNSPPESNQLLYALAEGQRSVVIPTSAFAVDSNLDPVTFVSAMSTYGATIAALPATPDSFAYLAPAGMHGTDILTIVVSDGALTASLPLRIVVP